MRKILLVPFLALFLFALSLSLVFAEDTTNQTTSGTANSTTTNPNNSRLGILNDKRQDLRETRQDLKEKVASKQAELKEKRKELVKMRFEKAISHLSLGFERLNKIAGKVQSRITKFKNQGADVSAGQAALDACSVQKAAVAAAIADAKTAVAAIDVNATTADGSVKAAYAAVKKANEALKSYHKCLVMAGEHLKTMRGKKEGTHSAE